MIYLNDASPWIGCLVFVMVGIVILAVIAFIVY
jgi:hypothetical protein